MSGRVRSVPIHRLAPLTQRGSLVRFLWLAAAPIGGSVQPLRIDVERVALDRQAYSITSLACASRLGGGRCRRPADHWLWAPRLRAALRLQSRSWYRRNAAAQG